MADDLFPGAGEEFDILPAAEAFQFIEEKFGREK